MSDDNLSWLRDDMRALREGQTTLHGTVSGIDAKLDAHKESIDEHGKSIKTLEAQSNRQSGFIRAIVLIGGVLWTLITTLFGYHIAKGGK